MKLFAVEVKRNDWMADSETLQIVARSLPAAVKETQAYFRVQHWSTTARILRMMETGPIHRAQR